MKIQTFSWIQKRQKGFKNVLHKNSFCSSFMNEAQCVASSQKPDCSFSKVLLTCILNCVNYKSYRLQSIRLMVFFTIPLLSLSAKQQGWYWVTYFINPYTKPKYTLTQQVICFWKQTAQYDAWWKSKSGPIITQEPFLWPWSIINGWNK